MPTGKNPKPLQKKNIIVTGTYPVKDLIYLTRSIKTNSLSFFEIIEKRKSSRNFSEISLELLSSLLWHSSKIKNIWISELSSIHSHRPAPSAGAIHPIDIVISLPETILNRKLYYYNPFSHSLGVLELESKIISDFFNHINDNLLIDHAIILWTIIDINRTAAIYENPESLVWRDCGALLCMIQLVATVLDLNSCIIGTLGQPFFSKIFPGRSELLSGGGILIG